MWSHAGVQGQVFWFTELFIKADQYWNLFCCHSCSSLCHFRTNPIMATWSLSLSLSFFFMSPSYLFASPSYFVPHHSLCFSLSLFHLLLFHFSLLHKITSLLLYSLFSSLLSIITVPSFGWLFFFLSYFLKYAVSFLLLPASWFRSIMCRLFHRILDSFSSLLHIFFSYFHVCSFFQVLWSYQKEHQWETSLLLLTFEAGAYQAATRWKKKKDLTENPAYSARLIHMAPHAFQPTERRCIDTNFRRITCWYGHMVSIC